MSKSLTLGFVAHVDAGKTSLTERLLYHTGVLDEIGSVDAGNTQTDSLALERQRGITIKAAVASFVIEDVTVNLLDTPGHPDFIAEVERVLGVLDGAVLIISAVEGVQPQTRVLMRALQRLGIPTLIFVNKIDRRGAREQAVLREIADRLTPRVVAMGTGHDLGTRTAAFAPYPVDHPALLERLIELLAPDNEALLSAYVEDGTLAPHRLLNELRTQTRRAKAHPVFFGSAITGAGLPELAAGIVGLLPAAEACTDGQLSGTVFKVARGAAGEKIAYARLRSGTIRVRDRIAVQGEEQKVTAIAVYDGGAAERRGCAEAGQITQLWGLDARIGDAIGQAGRTTTGRPVFAPPTLTTVVVASRPREAGKLHAALTQLAEQDPLVALQQDDVRGELSVSLYGEVQKEVLQATLAAEFGVAVQFRDTTPICIERVVGTGAAVEHIDVAPNPFLATVGLRVEPAPLGSGIHYGIEVELGSMPFAFMRAIEETVHVALQHGRYGWQVTDCRVTLTHTGYWPRQSHMHATFDKTMSSTAGDFRGLTPLVLMDALRAAGTVVCEPVQRLQLEIPTAAYGALLPVLAQLRGVPSPPVASGDRYLLQATIPAAHLHELQQRLPHLTGGEGVLESHFDHYQPVRGPMPERAPVGADPRDRRSYLLSVVHKVG